MRKQITFALVALAAISLTGCSGNNAVPKQCMQALDAADSLIALNTQVMEQMLQGFQAIQANNQVKIQQSLNQLDLSVDELENTQYFNLAKECRGLTTND